MFESNNYYLCVEDEINVPIALSAFITSHCLLILKMQSLIFISKSSALRVLSCTATELKNWFLRQIGVLGENPDSRLLANRYPIQLLEETIPRPRWDLNAHPPTLAISSRGQERAPRLTHWATDRVIRRNYFMMMRSNNAKIRVSSGLHVLR